MDEEEFMELMETDREKAKFILMDKSYFVINGVFNHPPFEENYTNFAGYFVAEKNSGKLFLGMLHDVWGDSKIRGELSERVFHMIKQYGRRTPIEYNFKKAPTGLWLGEWASKPAGKGNAVCMFKEEYVVLEHQ
ncbi:hypothetical protein ACFL6I_23825 [candidate division KSB1 bacterium]